MLVRSPSLFFRRALQPCRLLCCAASTTPLSDSVVVPAGKSKKQRKKHKGESPEGTGGEGSGTSSAMSKAASLAARPILDMPMAYKSFDRVMPLRTFRATFDGIAAGECNRSEIVRLAGRVIGLRDMGRILFCTIRGDAHVTAQIVVHVTETFTKEDLKALKSTLRVGDIVGAEGSPARTQRGELSLYASQLVLLVPYRCTDQAVCPDLKGFLPVADVDVKYRYRFVDMMTNSATVANFRRRHKIIKSLRTLLDEKDFVEVETPMLHSVASGANARPFVTHHNANDADLFLRVAPELHLKQCVAGGMERVYEIGRVFRNEGADRSHNPEFTSCELYAAYHSYRDLMPLTEEIVRTMAIAANGHTRITVRAVDTQEPTEIDLSQPFRRVSVYDEIQRVAGVELPAPTELTTPKGLAYMSAIMLQHHIPFPSVRTGAKMFDKLIDYFITDKAVQPTFVIDHPLCMSPLAKEHEDKPGLSERFELFINGTEYCNAYSELNDPQEQYFRFQQQLIDKHTGDDEAMGLDETFLKALQVGLPPTAGWGMGIDRMVMLLNGSSTIRDEIIFPLLRQDTDSHDTKRRRKTASFFGFDHQMTLFCLNALEEEMSKKGAPNASVDNVRQLRRFIGTMDKRNNDQNSAALREIAANCEVNSMQFELTMAVLRLFCGRFKS